MSFFTQTLHFLITGDLLCFYLTKLFSSYYYSLKNHRYSDNLDGFHNLFVKPATVCSHNLFGISVRIALEVPITLRRIYIFPVIESSHPGACCVSWFNQMLFKSFKQVTCFLHIVFLTMYSVVVAIVIFLLWWFLVCLVFRTVTGTLLKYLLNCEEFLVYRQAFFLKSYSLMYFIFAGISCFHR